MKTISAKLYLLLIAITLLSCSKENVSENTDTENLIKNNFVSKEVDKNDLLEKVKIKNSTSSISEFFFELGLKKINVETNSNNIVYKLSTLKDFMINVNSVDLSTFEFIISDNFIYEREKPECKLTIKDDLLYLVTPEKEGFITDFSDFGTDKNLVCLVLFLKEITSDQNKFEFETQLSNYELRGAGCDFMHTYYVVGAGLTISAANASLEGYNGWINGFTCRQLNTSVDVTNWGGFYTATNTFCCGTRGYTGMGGSW